MGLSLAVIAGSGLGGLARYWLGLWVAAALGGAFPWGTLLINVLGSLIIGWAGSSLPSSAAVPRAFVMVGLCGGFTTFSSFSLQTVELLQADRGVAALAYAASSVLVCLLGTLAGIGLGRAFGA